MSNSLLFRWAFKLYPLIPSRLILDALEIALTARELDMRASPYDLFGYNRQKPIMTHMDIQNNRIYELHDDNTCQHKGQVNILNIDVNADNPLGFRRDPICIETIEVIMTDNIILLIAEPTTWML